MIRRLRQVLGDRRGAVAVEIGFVLPLVLALIIGIIDFSRAMLITATIDQAARDGARYASLHGADSETPLTDTQISTYVMTRVPAIDPDALSVTVAWQPDNFSGSEVSISLSYPFDFLISGFFQLDPITLTRQSALPVL